MVTMPHSPPQFKKGDVGGCAGAIAGAASTLVTHPPDVVRTRMQLAGGGGANMAQTIRAVYNVSWKDGKGTGARFCGRVSISVGL